MSENNKKDEDDNQESYVEGDNVFYTTGDLEKMLGISRDMVRYYTIEFKEFLNPQKTKEGKGGHFRYQGQDIETLRLILTLRPNNSVEQIKGILKDKDIRAIYVNAGNENNGFMKVLMENNKYLMTELAKYIPQVIQSMQETYLKQEEVDKQIINEMRNEIKDLNEKIDKMIELQEEQKQKKGFFNIFKK